MNGFFSLDGPFMRYGGLLADMVILSFLLILLCLPLVTAGASVTAAYYVATRRICDRDGYLLRDFFTSFKKEFIRTTLIFVFCAALLGILFVNINVLSDPESAAAIRFQSVLFILRPLQWVIFFEVILIMMYIFPLASRFDMKVKDLFKTAFFMANRHMLTTVGMVVLLILLILITFTFGEMWLFLIPGVYVLTSSYLLMRIFKKYRPEIALRPGDIAVTPLLTAKKDDTEDTGNIVENSENAEG
jgi:uncharacterized membrane protein YesL